MKTTFFTFTSFLLFWTAVLPAFINCARGQGYAVDWYKISGGGTSVGGNVSVTGAIGQTDAMANSALTGGNYSLTGGFWSLYAVQQPGFPTLFIRQPASNLASVFWQNSGHYILQTNSNLATTNWSDYGGSIVLNNGTNVVTVLSPAGNLFFRLK